MSTAAGIIVFRNKNNHPEILGLIALSKDRKRVGGIYDIPKGSINSNEDKMTAAKRECFEESGLRPKIISTDSFTDGKIIVWLGVVNEDSEIIIAKNPETGLIEHEGYEWIKPEIAKKECLNYLTNHMKWAEKKIWEYFKI